jgi:hypothetical protein
MSEVWSICPIPNTEAIVTIKDENGLEIGTCIAEDAPMIVLAPELIEFAQMVAAGKTKPEELKRSANALLQDLERSVNALLRRAQSLGDDEQEEKRGVAR